MSLYLRTRTEVHCATEGCPQEITLDGMVTAAVAVQDALLPHRWLALGLHNGTVTPICTEHTWALLALLGYARAQEGGSAKDSPAEFREAVVRVLGSRDQPSAFSGLFGPRP